MEEFKIFCLPECRARGHYLRLVHMMARQEYGVQMVSCFYYWYCIGGSWCFQSNESFADPKIHPLINNNDDLTIVRRRWLFRDETSGFDTFTFYFFLRSIFHPHHYVLCPTAFDEKGICIIPLPPCPHSTYQTSGSKDATFSCHLFLLNIKTLVLAKIKENISLWYNTHSYINLAFNFYYMNFLCEIQGEIKFIIKAHGVIIEADGCTTDFI